MVGFQPTRILCFVTRADFVFGGKVLVQLVIELVQILLKFPFHLGSRSVFWRKVRLIATKLSEEFGAVFPASISAISLP